MTEPAVTGTTVLRQTVRARNKSPHALSLIAREVGVGASTLEAFAAGTVDLDVEMLKALTPVLYPFSEYDAELDLLRSSNKAEPISLGIRPPPYQPKPLNLRPVIPGPQPVTPQAPQAKKRAGWLGGWL